MTRLHVHWAQTHCCQPACMPPKATHMSTVTPSVHFAVLFVVPGECSNFDACRLATFSLLSYTLLTLFAPFLLAWTLHPSFTSPQQRCCSGPWTLPATSRLRLSRSCGRTRCSVTWCGSCCHRLKQAGGRPAMWAGPSSLPTQTTLRCVIWARYSYVIVFT